MHEPPNDLLGPPRTDWRKRLNHPVDRDHITIGGLKIGIAINPAMPPDCMLVIGANRTGVIIRLGENYDR